MKGLCVDCIYCNGFNSCLKGFTLNNKITVEYCEEYSQELEYEDTYQEELDGLLEEDSYEVFEESNFDTLSMSIFDIIPSIDSNCPF